MMSKSSLTHVVLSDWPHFFWNIFEVVVVSVPHYFVGRFLEDFGSSVRVPYYFLLL